MDAKTTSKIVKDTAVAYPSTVFEDMAIAIHQLNCELRDLQRVLRIKHPDDLDGRTHWDGCWRYHLDCAIEKVEQLQKGGNQD